MLGMDLGSDDWEKFVTNSLLSDPDCKIKNGRDISNYGKLMHVTAKVWVYFILPKNSMLLLFILRL